MTKTDLDYVEISAEEVKNALRRPSDFGWFGDDKFFDTWILGDVIRHRDSNLLEESNADALLKMLNTEHSELKDDWEIIRCNHWAVGWAEHLGFRAVEDDRETPTTIFKILKAWVYSLLKYPFADDNDLSEREYKATLNNIEMEGRSYVKDGAAEGWESEVYSWLSDSSEYYGEVEDSDFNGAYPSEKSIKAALKALGYLDPEYEEEEEG